MTAAPHVNDEAPLDAVIIGAGFGGLRMLIELRRMGLNAKVFEAGTDVGGTWYWNRYPGARTDTEAWAYCFQFDEELLQEWTWRDRYPNQAQVHEYLRHVADRYDLRRDIEFNARVASIVRNEEANTWTVTARDGRSHTATYCIPAVGPLSFAYEPPFPGLADFEGQYCLTARWPKEPVDFTGKRVGVVGTGATGVQVIPVVAQTAEHLVVFQRTANYVLPARNGPIEEAQQQAIKQQYSEIWAQVRQQFFAFPMNLAGRVVPECTEEEIERVLEHGWEVGGFRFLFETFDDTLLSDSSNEVVADFIRRKIRHIVTDPATAELLCPKGYPFGGKRPPLGHHYFETFNRDNVALVDVSGNAIERVTPKGLQLSDGTVHELDVLIFATGFDAATGSLTHMDIRGREGQSIADEWADGPETHLGISTAGFPNLFMLSGPQTPFANIPPVVENSAEWVGRAIQYMRDNDIRTMEASPEAMDAWGERLQAQLDMTVLGQGEKVGTWFLGGNVPGKANKLLMYFGGAGQYFADCAEVEDEEYRGFTFETRESALATAGG